MGNPLKYFKRIVFFLFFFQAILELFQFLMGATLPEKKEVTAKPKARTSQCS